MTLAILTDQFKDKKVIPSDKIARKQKAAVPAITGVSVKICPEGSRLCSVKLRQCFVI